MAITVCAYALCLSSCAIRLAADPQAAASCKPVDPASPLAKYYAEALGEADKGLSGEAPPRLRLAQRNGSAAAFSGPPPWSTESARQLARIAESEQPSPASIDAASMLWNLLAKIVPVTSQAEERLWAADVGSAAAAPEVEIVRLSVHDHWESQIAQAVQAGGDGAMFYLTGAALQAARAIESTPEMLARRASEHAVAEFVMAYFRAYFRAGKVFQAQLKTDELAQASVDAIPADVKMTDDQKRQVRKVIASTIQTICKEGGDSGCLLTSALGKEAFVTRSGSTIQFEGITLALGDGQSFQAAWDYPRSKEFAPQMIRVLVEGAFDARLPYVPAAATATACKAKLYPDNRCLSESLLTSTPGLHDAVAAVDEKAGRSDSMAGAVTGTVIRSFSVLALNNEAAAASIENLAAVIARKVTERAAWRQTYTRMCTPDAPPAVLRVSKR